MPFAYALISTEPGAIEEVLASLKKIREVKEAYGVYGVYDIITKINAESMNALKETITSHIRQLNKVISVNTIIVLDPSSTP